LGRLRIFGLRDRLEVTLSNDLRQFQNPVCHFLGGVDRDNHDRLVRIELIFLPNGDVGSMSVDVNRESP
jgi:hypothetical protein